MLRSTQVSIKTPDEQAKLRVSGRPPTCWTDPASTVGVTTDDLDRICNDYIVKVQQTIPRMGYRGFPRPCALQSTTWFAMGSQ